MNLKIVSNFIRSAWIDFLRVFHNYGGRLGLWNHYTLRGKNAGDGFTVECGTRVLCRIEDGGFEALSLIETWDIYMGYIYCEEVRLHSIHDWPSHVLGEYKPWKSTFNNK